MADRRPTFGSGRSPHFHPQTNRHHTAPLQQSMNHQQQQQVLQVQQQRPPPAKRTLSPHSPTASNNNNNSGTMGHNNSHNNSNNNYNSNSNSMASQGTQAVGRPNNDHSNTSSVTGTTTSNTTSSGIPTTTNGNTTNGNTATNGMALTTPTSQGRHSPVGTPPTATSHGGAIPTQPASVNLFGHTSYAGGQHLLGPTSAAGPTTLQSAATLPSGNNNTTTTTINGRNSATNRLPRPQFGSGRSPRASHGRSPVSPKSHISTSPNSASNNNNINTTGNNTTTIGNGVMAQGSGSPPGMASGRSLSRGSITSNSESNNINGNGNGNGNINNNNSNSSSNNMFSVVGLNDIVAKAKRSQGVQGMVAEVSQLLRDERASGNEAERKWRQEVAAMASNAELVADLERGRSLQRLASNSNNNNNGSSNSNSNNSFGGGRSPRTPSVKRNNSSSRNIERSKTSPSGNPFRDLSPATYANLFPPEPVRQSTRKRQRRGDDGSFPGLDSREASKEDNGDELSDSKDPVKKGVTSPRINDKNGSTTQPRGRKKTKSKSSSRRRSQSSASRNRGKRCSYCQASTTPMWRHGPEGYPDLCNRCGVKYMRGRLVFPPPEIPNPPPP